MAVQNRFRNQRGSAGMVLGLIVGISVAWWIALMVIDWMGEKREERVEKTYTIVKDKYGRRAVVALPDQIKVTEVGSFQTKCSGFPTMTCE